QNAGQSIVIDLGSGAMANLMKVLCSDLRGVGAVFLTHLHADHTSDIAVLRYALSIASASGAGDGNGTGAGNSAGAGNRTGAASGVSAVNGIGAGISAGVARWAGDGAKLPLFCPDKPDLEYAVLKSYGQFDVAPVSETLDPRVPGLKFRFAAMRHPYPCFALSAEAPRSAGAQDSGACADGACANGASANDVPANDARSASGRGGSESRGKPAKFVFSGDTAWNEDIIALAEGADLLVLDAGLASSGAAAPAPGKPPAAHLTPEECGIIAARANVKRLLLTHFAPGSDVARCVKEARAGAQKAAANGAPGSKAIPIEAAVALRSYEI
ncbi:MAG: MBL fold metallo-hydrolase, partial [Clostridiales bacterium]|nr:MBL fold metallo-hydrolase [Clostridiales bacterium]